MNQKNFITRRSYSNEATLFINPKKTKTITKSKNREWFLVSLS